MRSYKITLVYDAGSKKFVVTGFTSHGTTWALDGAPLKFDTLDAALKSIASVMPEAIA